MRLFTLPKKINKTLNRVVASTAKVFILLLAISTSACSQTGLNQAANMEHCQIKQTAAKGGSVKIELERAGATGFQWFVELPATGAVKLQDQGEAVVQNADGRVGAPVKQWWNFQVGDSVVIDFFLYRAWEGKQHAAKHCVVSISVK